MARRVLVTSTGGIFGKHIVNSFLNAGFTVRAGLRSLEETHQELPKLRQTFDGPLRDGRLDVKTLKSFSPPEVWEEALTAHEPVDTVVYVPSQAFHRRVLADGSLDRRDSDTRILDALAAVKKYAPSVKRVIAIGQLSNIINSPDVPSTAGRVYTEDDWSSPDGYSPSINRMRDAERAAWALEKPGFDLVFLHTATPFGPDLPPFSADYDPPRALRKFFHHVLRTGLGEDTRVVGFRREQVMAPVYVDIRDNADAVVKAATVPEAGGKRFIICAEQGHMSHQRLLNLSREALPDLRHRIPRGDPASWEVDKDAATVSAARSRDVLGMQYRTPAETIGDVAAQAAELLKTHPHFAMGHALTRKEIERSAGRARGKAAEE